MIKFNKNTKLWQGPKIAYPYPSDTFMGEVILEKLKETPDRVVQINHDTNYELKCHELRLSSIRVAQNLMRKFGIKSDDVVTVIGSHCKEMTFLLTACILIGAPINPLDTSLAIDDLKELFIKVLPKLIVCDLEVFEKVARALKESKIDGKIIALDHENASSDFNELLTPTDTENDFVAPKFDKSVDEKILAIASTSGTTGRPKFLPKSHAAIMNTSSVYVQSQNHDGVPGISLRFCPLSWLAGLNQHIYLAFSPNKVEVITKESFSVEKLAEIMEKHKITCLTVPPADLSLILQSEIPKTVDHGSLRTINCFGSIVSETSRKKFEEIFPDKDLLILYGMNEVGPVAITLPGEYKTAFCVGSAIASGLSLKIVDDENRRLAVGEIGEICLIPPTKFHGYAFSSSPSEGELDGEKFYHTGDIGYFDEKGCLFIVDRIKDVVTVLNFRVPSGEIESVIEAIDGVVAVSVVGIPDDIRVNLLTAVVVKQKGCDELTEQFIIDFVAEKLDHLKHLHGGVFFVDKLPHTASGKVRKHMVTNIVKQMSHIGLNGFEKVKVSNEQDMQAIFDPIQEISLHFKKGKKLIYQLS